MMATAALQKTAVPAAPKQASGPYVLYKDLGGGQGGAVRREWVLFV
jgi:hypothetical protein